MNTQQQSVCILVRKFLLIIHLTSKPTSFTKLQGNNMINEYQLELAIDWFDKRSKGELLWWATNNKLDVGQEDAQLHSDWQDKIIDAYAMQQ
jgi:hypothetical protein